MGFYLKAKHDLNSKFDLRPNLVSNWGREKRRERGEEEKREEEEEEEEEDGGAKIQKGMEFNLGYGSCMNFHTIAWLWMSPNLGLVRISS